MARPEGSLQEAWQECVWRWDWERAEGLADDLHGVQRSPHALCEEVGGQLR